MITSAKNERIKQARAVREGRVSDRIFIEGEKLTTEALTAGVKVKTVFGLEALRDGWIEQLPEECWVDVTVEVMKSLADTVSPQGVVVIAERPKGATDFLSRVPQGVALMLDRLQDPGNVGTLIRTAEGAGVSGVVATAGTADPFSPKALRSSMGSAFRMPFHHGGEGLSVVQQAREKGWAVVAADGAGAVSFREWDWRQPTLLILGNEGGGVQQALLEGCDQRLAIPMQGEVESLNVASAGAVMVFEAQRQQWC